MVLLWWDDAPALAARAVDGTAVDPTTVRRWQGLVTPADLMGYQVLGQPLHELWPSLPIIPWPHGWTTLLLDEEPTS